MKKQDWIQLITLNLLVILCIFLPFLPGPYDKLSIALSGIAQVIGFAGFLLVPVGILWLILETRSNSLNDEYVNNWDNGYYFAIVATLVCILLGLFFVLTFLITTGPSAAVISLAVLGYGMYRIVPAIRNLKGTLRRVFNPVPMYLFSLPLIAFIARALFLGPVSDYSRNYAINKAERVIVAIEDYYEQKNQYPESLHELYFVPKPSIMGIDEFRYERTDTSFTLSFVQMQHLLATREVVIYNKNDSQNLKGYFADYDTDKPHWRYYWFD